MARTNTDIDKDLEKTKGAVALIDKSLAALNERVNGLGRGLNLREASYEKSLKYAEEERERLREDLKNAGKSLREMETSVASLIAKIDQFEKAARTMESRRWQLYVAVPITAIITAAVTAGINYIAAWSRK